MILQWRRRHTRYRRLMFAAIARDGSMVGWTSRPRSRSFRVGVLAAMLAVEVDKLGRRDLQQARELASDAHEALDYVIDRLHRREVAARPPTYSPPQPYQPSDYEIRRDRTAQAWRVRCSVYFVQQITPAGDGPIKIGVSADVQKRLRQLRTGVPHDLALLATMQGDDTTEYGFHVRFAADRISPRAEWFRPSPELLAFIASVTATSEAAQ